MLFQKTLPNSNVHLNYLLKLNTIILIQQK